VTPLLRRRIVDWRLRGQERYLGRARLRRAQYRPPSTAWDHDHCEFCNAKLADWVASDVLREGWQTEDEYRWICDACFEDFREQFGFEVLEASSKTRGVELHDAEIEAIRSSEADVIVSLHAFVHDDWKSRSCAGQWQRIDLQLREATADKIQKGEGSVLDGELRVNSDQFVNMLPIPFRPTGAIVLTLSGHGLSVVVRARRLCAMRARGLTIRQVLAQATREGLRNRMGRPFTVGAVHNLVKDCTTKEAA
jgi:hypothetical protein